MIITKITDGHVLVQIIYSNEHANYYILLRPIRAGTIGEENHLWKNGADLFWQLL